MSRTPIPRHLIHQPDEVDRNGRRFDYLCRLAEEVALPVVQQALVREFDKTAVAGAEILSDEARQVLEMLAEEAAILTDLDESTVIESVRKSLSERLPAPDEEECRQHTRDFSQVLMSTWLESLRNAHQQGQIFELSDCLLPSQHGIAWLMQRLVGRSRLPGSVTEAVGWFAPNEEEVITVLTTLREKLFATHRLVDLPFDLAMLGAPPVRDEPARVMVMADDLFITLLKEMENQQRAQREHEREEREQWLNAALQSELIKESESIKGLTAERWANPAGAGLLGFDSSDAQIAAANVSVPLQPSRYRYFAAIRGSQIPPSKIQSTVRRAMATAIK